MTTGSLYTIGGCTFRIVGAALEHAIATLTAFQPFIAGNEEPEMFTISYCIDEAVPQPVTQMYTFSSDGVSTVFSTSLTGYVLQMEHVNGGQLSLWCDTSRKRLYLQGQLLPMMLRFALWTAYGLGTVTDGRIAIHSSCIVTGDRAYLFLGESGTGKSTHTRLWRENITGSHLLNDDSPIVAAEADGIWVYGSPWSGKTPCYRQERYRLGGCVRLSQAPYNRMNRLSVLQAYAALHPSCPPQFAQDDTLYSGICESLNALLTQVPVYHLACLPDVEAARLSYRTLCPDNHEAKTI